MMLMKLTCLLIVLVLCITLGCKKNDSINYPLAIIGNWKYQNSMIDSINNIGSIVSSTMIYDSLFTAHFSDTLQFTTKDTVYYTYAGVTTWSTYSVNNNQLLLMGSTNTAKLTITQLNLTSLQLQFNTGTDAVRYYANFSKY